MALKAFLSEKDIFILLQTGFGKSLVKQRGALQLARGYWDG